MLLQVVFATPGMLHAGQSLQIFKKWAGNEKNMVSSAPPRGREGGVGGASLSQHQHVCFSQVIMPGYCVQGTIGHKILNGQRKLEMEGRATVRPLLDHRSPLEPPGSFWDHRDHFKRT